MAVIEGPELVVFSTDYPHPEGGKDALARYRKELEGRLDSAALARFFGGAAEQALAVGA